MQEKIIFAGFGGQGIMLMGRLLAQAACLEGKQVTWMPSYGAEVRGGTAHSMVIISDREIASPVISKPTSCIVMNNPSSIKFERKIMPKGLMILNSSLARSKPTRRDINIVKLPLTKIATDLGSVKVGNMVALGAYVAIKKTVPLKQLIDALKSVLPARHHNLLPLNEKALREGAKMVTQNLHPGGCK